VEGDLDTHGRALQGMHSYRDSERGKVFYHVVEKEAASRCDELRKRKVAFGIEFMRRQASEKPEERENLPARRRGPLWAVSACFRVEASRRIREQKNKFSQRHKKKGELTYPRHRDL